MGSLVAVTAAPPDQLPDQEGVADRRPSRQHFESSDVMLSHEFLTQSAIRRKLNDVYKIHARMNIYLFGEKSTRIFVSFQANEHSL